MTAWFETFMPGCVKSLITYNRCGKFTVNVNCLRVRDNMTSVCCNTDMLSMHCYIDILNIVYTCI